MVHIFHGGCVPCPDELPENTHHFRSIVVLNQILKKKRNNHDYMLHDNIGTGLGSGISYRLFNMQKTMMCS